MARTESRTQVSIWDNEKFCALSAYDQRTYWLLYSQRGITLCGVQPLTIDRWVAMSSGDKLNAFNASLERLEQANFIVLDRTTQEIWVRGFAKHDHTVNSPRQRTGAYRSLEYVHSPRLRELAKSQLDRLTKEQDEKHQLNTLYEPDSDRESDRTKEEGGRKEGGLGEDFDAQTHQLCDLLASDLKARGAVHHTVTKTWLKAAKSLLGKRPYGEVEAVLRWAMADDHDPDDRGWSGWRSQILSMPTFRDKYDKLVEAKGRAGRSRANGNGKVAHHVAGLAELRSALRAGMPPAQWVDPRMGDVLTALGGWREVCLIKEQFLELRVKQAYEGLGAAVTA